MDNSTYNELKNEVRKEQLLNFIKKYTKIIILVVIAIIIIGCLFGWYKYHMHKKAIQDSNLFTQAKEKLANNNSEEALDIFNNLIKNGTNGYQLLSSLEKTSYLVSKGQIKEATDVLEAARKNISVPKYYKDLMATMEYNIRFNNQTEDMKKLTADIKSNLNKRSSFYFFDLEIYAALLVQQKQYQDALNIYDEITTSDKVPADILERSKRLKGLLVGYIK